VDGMEELILKIISKKNAVWPEDHGGNMDVNENMSGG